MDPTNEEIKQDIEQEKEKIRLFKALLALSYESKKVKVENGRYETLVISEPDNGNVLYHAFGILSICETLNLCAFVTVRDGIPVIIIS